MYMRTALTMVAAMAICLGGAQAEEVTGASLIDKYLEASGGADKLAAVKTRVDTGTLTLTDMGMEAAYTNKLNPPNSVMSMDFGGTIVQNGLTDGVAWSVNPFQGNSKNETGREAQIFPTLGLIDAKPVAKCVGEEEVEGAACYKVETPSPEGGTLTFWFDKETGLLAKSLDDNGQTTIFGDYKEVDGLTMPHKISQSGGEFAIDIVLTKIEIDAEFEEGEFDIPEGVE